MPFLPARPKKQHPPRPCSICGKTFTPPYHVNNARQIKKTCSHECLQQLHSQNHLGPTNNWWRHGRYAKSA
jgi:hypothetical protein